MKNTFKLLFALSCISFALPAQAIEYKTNISPKIAATFNTDSQVLNAATATGYGPQFYLTMSSEIGVDYGVRLIVDTSVNTISGYTFNGFNASKSGVYLGSIVGNIADGCNGCNGAATPWLYSKEFAIVGADLSEINNNASKLGASTFHMGDQTYVEMGDIFDTIEYENPNCVPGKQPSPNCGKIKNYNQLNIQHQDGYAFTDYKTSVIGGTPVSEPLPLAVMISSMISLMFWRKKSVKKQSV